MNNEKGTFDPIRMELTDWIRRANDLTSTLQESTAAFAEIAAAYAEMQNNANKTVADTAFSNLVAARSALCAVQAGGARRRFRRATRKVLTPLTTHRHRIIRRRTRRHRRV